MDEYTLNTKHWLDERFKKVDEFGVFFAHQPIYGFRAGHCESGFFEKYARTYQIMKTLSRLSFKTLLDAGGAEGYKAGIVRKIFNVEVTSSDLSEEACKRANEIFNIAAVPVDIHELPFDDHAFDIVLCSETLEHVRNLDKAVRELLRVAGKAVVITVPHESKEEIERHIENEEVHSHIHAFDPESFDFLKAEGYNVTSHKMISKFSVDVTSKIIDNEFMPQNTETASPLKKVWLNIYNAYGFIANKLLGERIAALILKLDGFIAPFADSYYAILFIIRKDKECFKKNGRKNISAHQIVNFKVPLHLLKSEDNISNIKVNGQHKNNRVCLSKMTVPKKELIIFFAQRSENITFYIDLFRIDSDSFELAGWSHINGNNAEGSKIYIVLQSYKRTYHCLAMSQIRPDVTAFFNNFNLDNSGFSVFASTAGIEKGKYRIGLYIEKNCVDRGFQFTDKHFIVEH